jgi:hypothetical protein
MAKPAAATYSDTVLARADRLIQDWSAAGLSQQEISDRLKSELKVEMGRHAVGRRLKAAKAPPLAQSKALVPTPSEGELRGEAVPGVPRVDWQTLDVIQAMREVYAGAKEAHDYHLMEARTAGDREGKSHNYMQVLLSARTVSQIFAEVREVAQATQAQDITISFVYPKSKPEQA